MLGCNCAVSTCQTLLPSICRLASKWFGDSLKYTRAAFSLAAKLAPCVLFIDEVDSLLGRRNSQKEHEALRWVKGAGGQGTWCGTTQAFCSVVGTSDWHDSPPT